MAFPSFDDAFPDFGFEEEYHVGINGGGRAFILDLPIELLLEISQYCKYGDVYSLMRANKLLHAVSIQRFYSVIPLYLNRIISPKREISTLQEMLSSFTDQHSSILRGLFARQEHLNALKKLVVCGLPIWQYKDALVTHQVKTLVYGILENAKYLKSLVVNTRPVFSLRDRPNIAFTSVTFSDALTSLRFPYLCSQSAEMLENMRSLTTLHINNTCRSDMLGQIPTEIGKRITDFRCAWNFEKENREDGQEDCATFSKSFISLLPNLQALAISYKVRQPDTYQDARMSPEILEGYIVLLRGLTRLQDLELLHCSSMDEIEIWQNPENVEVFFLDQLSPARPSLRRLTFPRQDYSGRGTWNGTTWKRGRSNTNAGEEEKQDEPLDKLWTPDPTFANRWSWWFKEFYNADEVRKVMHRLWGKEREIPRIDVLCR